MKKLIWILPALALAVSCSSLKMERALLDDPAVREPLPPLTLNPGFDVFMLRVDLRRAVHESIELNSRREERTVVVPNEYHPLVVDLGGGLILDYNDNFCIDLARLYGLSGKDRFRVAVEGSLLGGVPSLVERDGGTYRIERSSGFSRLETGTISDSAVMDDKKRHAIEPEGKKLVDTVQYPGGILVSKYLEKKPGDRIVYPGMIGDSVLVSLQGTSLVASDRLTVAHRGDRLEFGGNTLIRTARSVYVFDRSYRGFELRREGYEVRYFVNGKLLRTYRLLGAD